MQQTPESRLFRQSVPDDWYSYRRYQYLLAKLLFYTVIAVLTYLALSKASGVLSMVFLALLIAYVLDPVVDWFENKGVGRSSAIALLLVFIVSFTTLFSVWMVPTLVQEFTKVGDRVRELVGRDPTTLATSLESSVGLELGEEAIRDLSTKAKEYAPKVLEHLGAFVAQAASRTMGIIGWLVHLLVLPIFVFYFLRDFDRMKSWIVGQIPLEHRDFLLERARRADGVIGAWLRGQVEVALILAAAYALGLYFVGIKLAIPIGILAGLINIVPYLGFAFGIGLALLMSILDWTGIGTVIGVISLFSIVAVIEGKLITPKVVGEKVGLSPVVVIIALLLGGELLGLLGFLLAVPVTGALKTVAVEVMDWYRHSKTYLGDGTSLEEQPAESA
jgi:predicted PurR-regulated permease PerM